VYQRTTVQTGGLEGTSEDWQQVSGARRSAVELGGISGITNVFNGQVGWQKDQSGAVRELAQLLHCRSYRRSGLRLWQ